MSTVAAVATSSSAPSGIGVIRISGENAIAVADSVFKSVSGKKICEKSGYTALFGHIVDGEVVIDEAVALLFRAPKSYTGEDVVELSCHGGLFVLQRVLRAVLSHGALPAEAGEFTKRAFLNGKFDLAGAEAVMSLIGSQGEDARAASLNALEGSLSREITECRDTLARTAAFFAAWVDYPDEEIPELEEDELKKILTDIKNRLSRLLARFDSGRAVIEGVDTVIAGRPNAGKSTLLNALSGRQRAIVTSVAGTTRDVLEETVRVGNVTLRLADTAGIRSDTEDEIEKIGVELARERVNRAGLVLCVLDAGRELNLDEKELLSGAKKNRLIAVINKCDQKRVLNTDDVKKYADTVVEISAKTGEGLDLLKCAVEKVMGTEGFDPTAPMITTERQRICTKNAIDSLSDALEALSLGVTQDAVNVCVDNAIDCLNSLTGEKASDTVVNEVFKSFCVGK